MDKLTYMNLPNCLRLTNGEAEVVVTTDVGPRVLRYALTGQDNVFAGVPQAVTQTDLGEWRAYGGHRLWVAPEGMPGSYAPDNAPISYRAEGELGVRLSQPTDAAGFEKEMTVSLDSGGTGVTVQHRVTNRGLYPVEVAPWAITVVRGGGVTLFPQEPFRPHGEVLLPGRPLALWPFTDMSDPRWTWGQKFMRLRTDASRQNPQKAGMGNNSGWCAFHSGQTLFVKRFEYKAGEPYPDFGSNCETYAAGDYMEVETLGFLRVLAPGESMTHEERWTLFDNVTLGQTDDEIEAALTPLVARTR